MAIALVKSNEGVSTSAIVAPAFGSATTTGNLVVLCFASDNYNVSPDAGWTQSTGMEQQFFHGGYIWWRISAGETNFQYTNGGAGNSAWVIAEFSGCTATPYDISNGQGENVSGDTFTTPSITPTSGDRLLIGSINGSYVGSAGDGSGDLTSWLNSFTHIRSSGPVSATGTADLLGVGYLLVTANGSTGYSTGASYPNIAAFTTQSHSGLIIAFKAAASSVVLVLADYTIDNGLSGLDSVCDKIYICSAQPTTYTEAITTFGLGNKNWAAGNAFAAPATRSPNGRQITSIAITDGSVTANGTVTAWAAVDTANSRLLASGNLTGGKAVTSGQTFTLTAMTFGIPNQ